MDAARHLFGERGYGSTTLAEIAEGAGVSTGVLYHHWRGKQPLMASVVVAIHRDLTSEIVTSVRTERASVGDSLASLERGAMVLLRRAAGAGSGGPPNPDGYATALLGSLTALGRAVAVGAQTLEEAGAVLHALIDGVRTQRSTGTKAASRPASETRSLLSRPGSPVLRAAFGEGAATPG